MRALARGLVERGHDVSVVLPFYRAAREDNGGDHEEAMRDCIASVLMSPNFCYRLDLLDAGSAAARRPVVAPAPGAAAPVAVAATYPLSDYALASRAVGTVPGPSAFAASPR